LRAAAATYLSPRARKEAIVKELQSLLQRYRVVAIADITGLRANQFQRLRAKLREMAVIKVAKNTLMQRAVRSAASSKPGLEKLVEMLEGPNAFIFTDESAFTLYSILEKNKVTAKAKPGDKASRDIYIPAGNTGIPPGPILSMFKMLKVPTKIEEGSIYVTKDTLVLRKGDGISREAADLLAKLGIEPIEVGLSVKLAYEDGLVLTAEDLAIDVDSYRGQLAEAFKEALMLSVGLSYPTPESAPFIVAKAHAEALNLSINAAYPTKESAGALLRRAVAEAAALNARLPSS